MAKPRLRAYPTQGAITLSDGAIYPIERGGNFVRVKTADNAFTLRFDNDAYLPVVQNDVIRFTDGDKFGRLEIINDSGADLTVQLQVGEGEIDTNNVSISGVMSIKNGDAPNDELQIKTKAGTVVKTDDDETQSKLDDVITAINGQADYNNVGAQGAQKLDNTVSGVNTIFTPASNTDGKIVRFASMNSSSGVGYRMTLYVDTSAPASEVDGTKNAIASSLSEISVNEPFLVPAGYGLYACFNTGIYAQYVFNWDNL